MKKIVIIILIILSLIYIGLGVDKFLHKISFKDKFSSENVEMIEEIKKIEEKKINTSINYIQIDDDNKYQVFVEEEFEKGFGNYEEALKFALEKENSIIREKGSTKVKWDNYPPYIVYLNSEEFENFYHYYEALDFGKKNKNSFIYYRKDNSLIWTYEDVLKSEMYIENIPVINQYPELARGCEVTSLAMLLNYKGLNIDKMELAENIEKNPAKYIKENNKIYSGNPNNGFVGDMYNIKNNGLGVYHKPIYNLATNYVPYSVMDVTGAEFDDVLHFVSNGIPVWVITNTLYDNLKDSEFVTWHTEDGEIKITYKEHSVVIIGYNNNNIYFNDPHGSVKKIEKNKFRKAWEQMGSQGITFTN